MVIGVHSVGWCIEECSHYTHGGLIAALYKLCISREEWKKDSDSKWNVVRILISTLPAD
jgi:hypothetical protein